MRWLSRFRSKQLWLYINAFTDRSSTATPELSCFKSKILFSLLELINAPSLSSVQQCLLQIRQKSRQLEHILIFKLDNKWSSAVVQARTEVAL